MLRYFFFVAFAIGFRSGQTGRNQLSLPCRCLPFRCISYGHLPIPLLLFESFVLFSCLNSSLQVAACPCALGLAAPTAIAVATGVGARLGVIFKSGSSFEMCHKVRLHPCLDAILNIFMYCCRSTRFCSTRLAQSPKVCAVYVMYKAAKH